MSSLNETLQAGKRVPVNEKGSFFRLRSTSAPVDVRFYSSNKMVAEALQVEAGYSEIFDHPGFDRVDITSASTQTVRFEIRESSRVSYDRSVGEVDILPASSAVTAADVNCPTGVSTQVLAANSNRRRVHIANMGAATVRWSGESVATAKGAPLHPGMVLVLENTSAVWIRNDSGGAVSIAITEES